MLLGERLPVGVIQGSQSSQRLDIRVEICRSKTQEIIWSFIRRTLCFMHYTFFSCYYEKTGVADYLLIFVDFC